MSQVIEGLQWVLDKKDEYKIRVVNLSLGSDPSESYRRDPLCRAVEQIWKAGIVVTAAAGNDGPAPGSIDTPGNDPLVITVGAIDDEQTTVREDDQVPEFSSRGPTNDGLRKPDIVAPGVGIVAPRNGGGYVSRTGTSMATPFITGTAALLLSREPDLTPDQVKNKLKSSAENRHLPNVVEGAGYLDAQKLLQLPVSGKNEAAKVLRPRLAGTAREESARVHSRGALADQLLALVERFSHLQLFTLLAGLLFR